MRPRMSDYKAPSPSRRQLFKTLGLVPIAAAGLAGCARESDKPAEANAAQGEYKPSFFNAAEWAFIQAACDQLIPADNIGPSASQAGVPEFIDRHMQTPYASGDLWYMQGPFIGAAPQFGYQGPSAGEGYSAGGNQGDRRSLREAIQRQG